jgi:hypothetical protein
VTCSHHGHLSRSCHSNAPWSFRPILRGCYHSTNSHRWIQLHPQARRGSPEGSERFDDLGVSGKGLQSHIFHCTPDLIDFQHSGPSSTNSSLSFAVSSFYPFTGSLLCRYKHSYSSHLKKENKKHSKFLFFLGGGGMWV